METANLKKLTSITYNGKEYRLEFNLNVMEVIQDEYGTLENWSNAADGTDGEPNAKAVIFGIAAMLNEGIDMDNEERGEDTKPLTLKQVGRIITAIGIDEAVVKMQGTVIESTKSDEKNV